MSRWTRVGLAAAAAGALLVPLLLPGAQDAPADPPPAQTAPPPSAPSETAPAASAPGEEKEEEELAPGERLSADNNISWPVDI